jgi:dihydroorotate dehydrogenase electron transfer subunit
MREFTASIVRNEPIGEDFHRLDLSCPDMEPGAAPGQFVTVRGDWGDEPLLRRPFTIYDCEPCPSALSLLVKRVGPATELLAQTSKGDRLSVVGPIGRGFDLSSIGDGHTDEERWLYIVTGGCGVASQPLLSRHARSLGVEHVVLLYGAARATQCPVVDSVGALVERTLVATEDGSRGRKGLVTDLLAAEFATCSGRALVCACGPTPMLKAVADLAHEAGVACQVSLEAHMACGIGVCSGCVVPVKGADGRVWKKCCTDGPVFNADEILWQELCER